MADAGRDEGGLGTHAGAADVVCAICHECPNDSSVASVSGCNHRFCFACINRWAQIKKKCPLCNTAFENITSSGGVATTVGGGTVNVMNILSLVANEVIQLERSKIRLLAMKILLEKERLILYLTQKLNESERLSILEAEWSAPTFLTESRIDEFKALAEGFTELNEKLIGIGGALANTERGLAADSQELNDRFDSWRATVQLAGASVNELIGWLSERGLAADIQELNDRFDSWRATVQLAGASVNVLSEWSYDH